MESKKWFGTAASALLLAAVVSVPSAHAQDRDSFKEHRGIRHVLLISVDGMHAVDFLNCSKGIAGANGGEPYCPNLAELGENGINYLETSTSKPSDSFPGLTAIVSGGSARTEGVFYDVAYDRSLNPPITTTGNGITGVPCTPGTVIGTRTEYEEGIDFDQTQLNGGAPAGVDGGRASINPNRLPRDKNCNPVYPWNFVRTNTIFGVIHAAGGYTAWADKHASYLSVSGPGDGTNVDDYYAPEVNSAPVGLPGVITPEAMSCATVPDPSQLGSYTDSFKNIQCNDTLKVNAVLNEIDGKTHNGKSAPVPNLLGMNFQAVSVGQKLIEKNVGTGGYLDAYGTPSELLLGEFRFVDDSIGEMVSHLKKQGLLDSTLVIITAKHGQSPIDPNRFLPIPGHSGLNGQTPSSILADLLPDSEVNQIGATQDDISILWLADPSNTSKAVARLEAQSPAQPNSANIAGISQIFAGASLTQLFNSPSIDPRTPDIIVQPNSGVIYTGSTKKQEEHGGFAHDDTNVIMLLSNPKFRAKTVTSPVETTQVAPTIVKALGLDVNKLQAVHIEGTQVLPGVALDSDNE
jgi:predicted AlkP superfamily pyrophosphatase or phosphodiesterase